MNTIEQSDPLRKRLSSLLHRHPEQSNKISDIVTTAVYQLPRERYDVHVRGYLKQQRIPDLQMQEIKTQTTWLLERFYLDGRQSTEI